MLTREDDVDAHALHARGWTISAIARHLGHDRKTIRAYVKGGRVAGQRARSTADPFDEHERYVRLRLEEDRHLLATTLFDELVDAGYAQSYQTLTRQIRARGLRPVCEACQSVGERATAVIEHPPGEETQWDWLELPDPPEAWGWGTQAHLLIGALAHSGRWRAVLCEAEDQPQLIDGLDRVARALGGLTDIWRFDRMATVCHPDTGRVTATFAAVAKHYGVSVAICPPRSGHRKGVVEKAAHTAAQRWWRTLGDDMTVTGAQASLDRLCVERLDGRTRVIDGERDSVAAHASRERLRAMPAVPFPATVTVERTVAGNARVAWRGNLYSVPPELARSTVVVTWRLGAPTIDIATPAGAVIARHRAAPDGAGVIIADHGHVAALNATALAAAAGAGRPHRRKERIPPGPEARAEAARLRGEADPTPDATVIDLARYARAAHERNTLR